VTLNTIALELVPSDVDRGRAYAAEEAAKVRRLCVDAGIADRIRHIMIPGMIEEDEDRPVEMKPKLDVLDYWSSIRRELPGVHALCTQVTSFLDKQALSERLISLSDARFDGITFVGVPRTMNDGEGSGVAPVDALSMFGDLVDNRGVILIPTRDGEQGRLAFKCDRGATLAMTQLLYSDAVVGFLREFSERSDHRPEVLLSFGFVPKLERTVGLIDWLIQDPGNPAVAAEQDFVRTLAGSDPDVKRRLLVDLYKRVIDGTVELGYPLSLHFEAPYGVSQPALDAFAEMLGYWSPHPPPRFHPERHRHP
jgi:hypothetical protein